MSLLPISVPATKLSPREGLPRQKAFSNGPIRPGSPRRPLPRALLAGIIATASLSALSATAHPQGCSQCKESIAQSPPATRRAYRNAIATLTLAATGVCTATALCLRRYR